MTRTLAQQLDRPGPSGLGVLPLAEAFGPTWQGEGPHRGQVAAFVRLGGCNLHCSWPAGGCDSAWTWNARIYNLREQITPTDVEDIVAFLRAVDVSLLVVTGGEPLLHQRNPALHGLLAAAAELEMAVEFETNGTLAPSPDLPGAPHFNVSPKLDSSTGDPREARIVPAALRAFTALAGSGRAIFKFVAAGPEDLGQVAELVETYGIPRRTVWIMPEGVDPDVIARRARLLADPVLARRWNLTLRDHRVLWPDEEKGR